MVDKKPEGSGNPYRNIPDPKHEMPVSGESKANDDDAVPLHYDRNALFCPCGRKYMHWDLAWLMRWDIFQYNVTKYLLRWRDKDGLSDLQKAKHHLEKYIELLEAERIEGRADPR